MKRIYSTEKVGASLRSFLQKANAKKDTLVTMTLLVAVLGVGAMTVDNVINNGGLSFFAPRAVIPPTCVPVIDFPGYKDIQPEDVNPLL